MSTARILTTMIAAGLLMGFGGLAALAEEHETSQEVYGEQKILKGKFVNIIEFVMHEKEKPGEAKDGGEESLKAEGTAPRRGDLTGQLRALSERGEVAALSNADEKAEPDDWQVPQWIAFIEERGVVAEALHLRPQRVHLVVYGPDSDHAKGIYTEKVARYLNQPVEIEAHVMKHEGLSVIMVSDVTVMKEDAKKEDEEASTEK